MAKHTTVIDHRWFVSAEMPRSQRVIFARQTKTFPMESEAKQYAKEMLAEERKMIAGTLLSPDQPMRRIISGAQVDRWIAE